MHGVEARLAAIAARQHGLVTLADVEHAGGGRNLAARRVRHGRWQRTAPGVYLIGGAPLTWHARLLAAVLAAGPGALASHRSAAVLWDLEVARPARPEITVRRHRRYRHAGVICHEARDLHLADPRRRAGIPVTGLRRTLLDLGAVLPVPRVRDAVDVSRRRYRLEWDEMLHTMAVHSARGRRGLGTLRTIAAEHFEEGAVTDSRFERLVERLLVGAGLPRPVFHHVVEVAGERYELDLAWPAVRVAVELDGGHHRSDRAFHADRTRRNRLLLAGWIVLHYTWRQYLAEPHRIVKEVGEALAQRAR